MFQLSKEFLRQQKLERERAKSAKKQFAKKIQDSKLVETIQKVESSKITMLSRFIIILAVVADLFGLIPVVGNFIGIVFGAILVVLYFFNGLGKGTTTRMARKTVRRWTLRLVLYMIEVLGFGFSWLPFFTLEALIDYSLSKRGFYKTIEKTEKVIGKLK
ncbi:MAG: hypothetical protein KAQ63_03115 [Candidatus Moranbacteria bacterium]|nr:hypothetical protein [Candidatus Moranbacteria bacterium]